MGKYVAAAVVLASYAALAAWAVREEGSRYRAALRRVDAEPSKPITVETAAPEPPPPPPAKPVETTAPVVVAKAEHRQPKHTPPPRHAPPPPPPAHTAAPKPSPFWLTPRMKQVWDVEHLAPADEQRLGAALSAMVLDMERPKTDGPFLRRAEKAAEPILDSLGRKDAQYTITILDSDHANAFSHPGGYIYLTTGLFDLVGGDEDEDFVLQFAVAHEVAHLELKHAIKCLADPDLSKSGLGTLPQFALFVFPLGYPDAMDFEADRWAYDRLTHQLRRTPHEALAFLRRLEGYARRNGFENGRRGLKPMPNASPLDNHLRAHPAPYKRIEKLTTPPAKPAT